MTLKFYLKMKRDKKISKKRKKVKGRIYHLRPYTSTASNYVQ